MPRYRLRAIGADFEAADDGHDFADADVATAEAKRAGIALAAEEIEKGKNCSVVEAHVLDDRETIIRYVIALSVEALQTD